MTHKLIYHDTSHQYHLNGRRAKSVTNVAKIAPDSFQLWQWHKRQVAIGMMLDPKLREKVAANVDNRDALDGICQEAMEIAGAHDARNRGSQMHRASELADTGGALLTEQQREDADLWVRTMDAYGITILPTYVEQFVIWPDQVIAGRYDRIVGYRQGTAILDLKSGENAVRYPQSTSVQLALYANAPFMSDGITRDADRSVVESWRPMPDDLDRRTGYVIRMADGMDVGELWRINIEHGLIGGRTSLELVEWRKKYSYGADLAQRIEGEPTESEAVAEVVSTLGAKPLTLLDRVKECTNIFALELLWRENQAEWTDAHTAAAKAHKQHLHGRSLRGIGAGK